MPDHKSFLKVVEDARNGIHSFQEEGFKLLNHESKVVDFYDDELVSQVYYQEIHDLVKRETKADLIQILPHITRNEAEAASGKRLGAHRLVHNDFTPQFDEIIKAEDLENEKSELLHLMMIVLEYLCHNL